jgi:polysaccharide deacetylase family protein (PEP-CTERM system associated)
MMFADQMVSERKHILSIAFEDYFHGPAFRELISCKVWGRLETRFERTCFDVLEQLDAARAKATFFVYPWVARQRPDLVQLVAERGHEVALAGQRGVSFRFLTPASLRKQLRTERDIVEQACGKKILGFRVTDVLLGPRDLWGLDVLAQEGFVYDSSLSPFLRKFAHEPWRRYVHRNTFGDRVLWEVPLVSYNLAGLLIPVAGGNYFRQFPETFVRRALRSVTRNSDLPLVLYFRLWDLDPSQPRIRTGSLWGDFRHYRNSEKIVQTLGRLFEEYRFTSIAGYLNEKQPDVERRPEMSPYPLNILASSINGLNREKERTAISIIIPCYNEKTGIIYLDNSLRELSESLREDYLVEFIIIDDGSRDGTWEIVNDVFGSRADFKLLRHVKNQGVAAAISTGLAHAREIACSIDCDCSYDPNQLIPMLRLMRKDVDLVTASPYHPAGQVKNVPSWRLLLSRSASFLYRIVIGRNLYTFTSCFRVYRCSAAMTVSLRRSGFLGIAEFTSKLLLQGHTVVEHPATLEVRMFGQSKMSVVKTIIGHLDLLSRLAVLRLRGQKKAPSKAPPALDADPTYSLQENIEAKMMCPTPLNNE